MMPLHLYFLVCLCIVLFQSLKLGAKEFKLSTFNWKNQKPNPTWQPSVCPAVADPVLWAICRGGETENAKFSFGRSNVNAKLVHCVINRVTKSRNRNRKIVSKSSTEQHTDIISLICFFIHMFMCVDVALLYYTLYGRKLVSYKSRANHSAFSWSTSKYNQTFSGPQSAEDHQICVHLHLHPASSNYSLISNHSCSVTGLIVFISV